MKRDHARQAKLEQEMAALFAAKTPFLVIDTETTGFLSDPKGQIIEISCVTQDGEVAFSSLVKADAPISPGASKAHGLHEKDLVDAPTFTEVWPQLLEALSQVKEIYCYNVPFDRGMFLKTATRFGLMVPDWVRAQRWHCVMEAYAEYHGDWSEWHQSYTYQKLSDACAALNVPMSEAHRATGDCLSTLSLMKALAARGQKTWEQARQAELGVDRSTFYAHCDVFSAAVQAMLPVAYPDNPQPGEHAYTIAFPRGTTMKTEGHVGYFTLPDGTVFILRNEMLYQQGEAGYEDPATPEA